MSHDLCLDLRVARQQAGLTQADCAHLLGVNKNRMTRLEKHGRTLSLPEACQLTLILNREFRSLFALEFNAALEALEPRLETLPASGAEDDPGSFNRLYTLSALAERIATFNERRYGR